MLLIYSGGHAAYQDTFVSDFLSFYPNPLDLHKTTWAVIIDFWHLDLSLSDTMLSAYYSKYGPTSRQPSCMLRSYLLSIKLKITSITKWVQFLKENPLYAILSGFPPNDVSGIGTFYDFFSRLWKSDSNHLSPKERYKKVKVKKGKKTGDKTPIDTNSTCSKFLPFLVQNKIQPNHAFSLIFRLYEKQFLNVSIERGLINPEKRSVAAHFLLSGIINGVNRIHLNFFLYTIYPLHYTFCLTQFHYPYKHFTIYCIYFVFFSF